MAGTVISQADRVEDTQRRSTKKDVESQNLLPRNHDQVVSRRTSALMLDDDSSSASDISLDRLPPKQENTFPQRQISRLLFGVVGIFAAYLYYGHIQEDLFKYRSPHGESFQSVWFLQSLESAASLFTGLMGQRVSGSRKKVSLRPFWAIGCSQVFAKAFTSLSLAAGLSFPVCILAKSAKIVPVMLGQLLLGGSKYGVRDYVFVVLIVCGTALLSSGSSHKHSGSSNTSAGVMLILTSLVMDGVTAGLQKRLKESCRANPPSTNDFMLYTNMAMLVVAFCISVGTHDLWIGLTFLRENIEVAHMICRVCILSAIGQGFIFYTIVSFDPMVCSTVTTTRKMFSVLWSVVSKGHVLSSQGSLGLALAMSGLAFEVQGKVQKMSNDCEKHPTTLCAADAIVASKQ